MAGTASARLDASTRDARSLHGWVLQELVPGRVEVATSLLHAYGRLLDVVSVRYTYESDEYVWPRVTELKGSRRFDDALPAAHLQVLRTLLGAFSGLANFNYKVRPDGRLAIFECNPRLGADLACDVPRARAREFFERMDGRMAARDETSLSQPTV